MKDKYCNSFFFNMKNLVCWAYRCRIHYRQAQGAPRACIGIADLPVATGTIESNHGTSSHLRPTGGSSLCGTVSIQLLPTRYCINMEDWDGKGQKPAPDGPRVQMPVISAQFERRFRFVEFLPREYWSSWQTDILLCFGCCLRSRSS